MKTKIIRVAIITLPLLLSTVVVTATPGDLDPSFGAAGKVAVSTGYAAEIYATAVQADGKIVVVGHHEQPQGTGLIARLNPDGTFDQTFGNGGIVTATAHGGNGGHVTYLMAVAIQPDGKIVTSGHFEEAGGCGPYRAWIVRLNTDGSIDTTFGFMGAVEMIYECLGTTAVSFANSVAIQPNGKIVVGGSAQTGSFDAQSMDFAVTRLNSNGSFDTTFSTDGMATFALGSDDDEAFDVAVHPWTGRIVLAGYSINTSGNKDFGVVMLSSSGTLDTSFGFFGTVRTNFANKTDQANSVLFQPDGKIVAGGVATTALLDIPDPRFALVRYNSNGTLDSTFGTSGKVTTNFTTWSDSASSIALQADGKIVSVGTAVNLGGTYANVAVTRHLSNGAIDTSFSGDGKLTTDFAGSADFGRGLAIQPDGKIVAAGYATTGSSTNIAMARYEP